MKPGNLMWRALGAIAALLVAAWLAVGLRATILEERGSERLTKNLIPTEPTPAQARTLAGAARDFDRASWLNPDRVPRMYYAQTILILGERRRARELARQVARKEPENLEIWRTARAIALALPDRAFEAEARRRIRELSPRASRSP